MNKNKRVNECERLFLYVSFLREFFLFLYFLFCEMDWSLSINGIQLPH